MAKRKLKIGLEILRPKPKPEKAAAFSYVVVAGCLIAGLMLMLYVLRVLKSLSGRPDL